MNSISTSCNQLTWKSVHVDIKLESKGLEFCHIEIKPLGLDLVLLRFASRTDLKRTFLFFRIRSSPDLSSCHLTLHFQVQKTHEQNQIQNPRQIHDQIKSSPLARPSLELQCVFLFH